MMSLQNTAPEEFSKVIRALDSPFRILLIKALMEKSMSAPEIYKMLVEVGFDIGDRDTVYKALQMLSDAGLIEKYYDAGAKRISYRAISKQILIDISTLHLKVTN